MLEAAMSYSAIGVPVFPVGKDKAPLVRHGLNDASCDQATIRQWWSRWPDAWIGIPTGQPSGLWVLDCDVRGSLRGEDNLDQIAAGRDLGGLLVQTPSGGLHRYYSAPPDWLRNSAGRLAPLIDVRATGGYVVAPPSPGYEILDSEDELIGHLEPAPDWLLALFQESARPAPPESRGGESVIGEGSRNDALARQAGIMRQHGMPQAAIEAALLAVNREQCRPPLDAEEVRKIAWSVSRYEPDQILSGYASAQPAIDFSGLFGDEPGSRAKPEPLSASALNPGGLLGMFCAWCDRTSPKRQPLLSLAGGIALMGVLCGRKVETPWGTRGNVQVLGVAASASGKDRSRKCLKDVLIEAGAERLYGGEDIASDAAIIAALDHTPELVFPIDEFGKFLRQTSDQRAAPHLANVLSLFLKLYSSADSTFKGKVYADAKNQMTIVQPHLVIYGSSVPDNLFSGMGADSVVDGYAGRLILMMSDDDDPDLQPVPKDRMPPGELTSLVRSWHEGGPGPDLAGQHGIGGPATRVVDRTAEADELMMGLERTRRELEAIAGDKTAGPLWRRLPQKVDQLALIHACSASLTEPVITAESVRWATEIACWSTARMAYECERHLSSNETERLKKRLHRLIQDYGDDGISRRDLGRRTKWLGRRQRDELIADLLEAGLVVAEESSSLSGGPKGYRYRSA